MSQNPDRIIRGELGKSGGGLIDKPEIVALNKIDAMTKEEITAKAAALEESLRINTAAHFRARRRRRVPETVQKLFAIIEADRAERRAIEIEETMTPEEKAEGWQP